MITHTTPFETLANAPVKQTDLIVIRQTQDAYGYHDDLTAKWTSSTVLMQVNIDGIGAFLGTATKKATVKLLGIVTTPVVGDVFQVRYGIYSNDPSVSGFIYISEGFFTVDSVTYDYDSGSTTVVMYDFMWTAQNTSYTDTSVSVGFTFPTTVAGLAQQMASAMGVTLMAGFSSLPNASYSILVDPYATISNATLATVVQEIAQTTGTTARISDVTLAFDQYNVETEILSAATLKTMKFGKTYGPVTSVILGRVPQNDNVVVSNLTPVANAVSAVNTTTNLLTITGNGMTNGTLVQIQSTLTLPAPLVAGTNYYVYTGGNANTFALSTTYAGGVAGTGLVDLTTAGTGVISLVTLPIQEVQINNNQIMDDDRPTLLPAVYGQLVGVGWSEVTADTIGLGWHEVGDVIQFTNGTTTVKAFLSEIHLIFAGSIKESLVSVVPDVATINYQTAGGILKSIYNTEIKVDKQNNVITSVVSQQDTFEDTVTTNLTQMTQDIDDIQFTVQKAGGGNLLLNSVGFAKDSALDNAGVSYDKLTNWVYNTSYQISTHGTVTSYQSSESQNNGGTSGQVVQMTGASVFITQRVNVAVNTPLCFGVRVKNLITAGDATITLSNGTDTFTIIVDDVAAYNWQELKIENFVSSLPFLDVKIQVTSAAQFIFTDLRLLYGSTLQGWIQSSAEMLATNVRFDNTGMTIFDTDHETETRVTYNEFSTRRKTDNKILFEADDSGVVTNDLSVHGATAYFDPNGTQMIKEVTIPSSSPLGGLAWVRVS